MNRNKILPQILLFLLYSPLFLQYLSEVVFYFYSLIFSMIRFRVFLYISLYFRINFSFSIRLSFISFISMLKSFSIALFTISLFNFLFFIKSKIEIIFIVK